MIAALVPAAALFLFREALADRILAPRHTAAAVLVWVGFAVTSLTLLRDSGVFGSEMPLAFMTLAASLSPPATGGLRPGALVVRIDSPSLTRPRTRFRMR